MFVLTDTETERSWDRLLTIPPGLELAALLACLEREQLNGYELAIVLAARARMVSYWQAEMYADLYALAHCPPRKRRLLAPT